jgi:metal-responsive CopG/Arc/MetJ family transcriptional regulator
MKVKTSISLSSNIVSELEKLCSEGNRSDFIEKALWRYVELLHREERDKRDRDIIDAMAPHLNAEAMDSLDFQTPI